MKKVIDGIYLRAIAHATEDIERVKDAMEFISGRRDFEVIETRGYHGNPIRIIELTIKKNAEIVQFWKHLLEMGIAEVILPFIEDMMDEDCNFYLRFDKQEAYLQRLAITDGGDAIALRMKVLSYPKNKKEAVKNFTEFISRIQSSQR